MNTIIAYYASMKIYYYCYFWSYSRLGQISNEELMGTTISGTGYLLIYQFLRTKGCHDKRNIKL